LIDNTSTTTGILVEMAAGARLERYTNVTTPIIRVTGTRNKIAGNGVILAARNFGGFEQGLFLLGPDPTITSTGHASARSTQHNWIEDIFILGKTSNTGWDGSVGFWGESIARLRGAFVSPALTTYYNVIRGVKVTQFDYGIFGSTDFNANSFTGCGVTSFGHAAIALNGYANVFDGVIVEKGEVQDATERFTFDLREKDAGPEVNSTPCDYDATEYVITAITKGATTVLTVSTDPTGTVSVADKVKVAEIVDSGAGDLEALLNGGHFEVTAVNSTTVTISADTSGASATYSSAGIVVDGMYPLIGARSNQINGWVEVAFNSSTQKVRLVRTPTPLGTYVTADVENVFGKNIVKAQGTYPGGAGPDGFSTRAAIGQNTIDLTSVGFTEYGRQTRLQDFVSSPLDDGTGSGWGGVNYRTFSDRMASAVENTAYDVMTIDNVGATSGSVLIKLTYLMREEANQDHEGGEISWLCPVTASTARTPIKYKDFQANYNSASQPFVNWSVVAASGTAANTGKFTLTATTDASIAGTEDIDITWKAEVMAQYGTSLDFDNDVTITNGGL
jgi:hypothetical protein